MDAVQQWTEGVSYAPCPPDEFCGRHGEREQLLALLPRAAEHGQAVMISGPPGIGKSSLLRWLAYDLQDRPDGPRSPVIRAEVFEPPRMIFSGFRKLLYDLQVHAAAGEFQEILESGGIREAAGYTDILLLKHGAPVEPVDLLPKTGDEIVGVFSRPPDVGYDRVRAAFRELLRGLGSLMRDSGRIIAILLDDAHHTPYPDSQLLLDTIQDLPPGVLFAFTVQDDPGYEAIHDCGVPHVPLQGMQGRDIQEMGQKRFDLAISDATAALLEETAGDPFSLVACFNALRRRNLAPSAANIKDLLDEEEDPAGLAFTAIPGYWQTWARDLSLLSPPLPASVMACMLGMSETDVTAMADRLQESAVFRRLPGGAYAFAHSLLQEHCRQRLSEDTEVALNARAADCFERFMHHLPGRLNVLLSIASHLFGARDYARAADLNLELGLRFYRFGDYDSALLLTERAVASAEHLGDGDLLATAVNQRDLIARGMADRA